MALSGPAWVNQFPTSTSIDDLVEPFKTNLTNFLKALDDAGANVSIAATYRPPERAFLMHYSYQVATEVIAPAQAPANPLPPGAQNIGIEWVHVGTDGTPDDVASIQAAAHMVSGYAIKYAPVLASRHTQRLAVDMDVTWEGVLSIADATGMMKIISSMPTDGGNAELHAVGASYGVIKLLTDPPHWSSDGH